MLGFIKIRIKKYESILSKDFLSPSDYTVLVKNINEKDTTEYDLKNYLQKECDC